MALILQAETYGTCFMRYYYFNIMFNQSMRYVHIDAVLLCLWSINMRIHCDVTLTCTLRC
jgi:hypothetical protein